MFHLKNNVSTPKSDEFKRFLRPIHKRTQSRHIE